MQWNVLFLLQGFEGTLVWENLDSAGLNTVNSSSVQLSDGGGVLKISSVRTDTVSNKMYKEYSLSSFEARSQSLKLCYFLELQIAEGILPHRSALGFPGLAGGFTFTIYGWSSNGINSENSSIKIALWAICCKSSSGPYVRIKKTLIHWQFMRLATFLPQGSCVCAKWK